MTKSAKTPLLETPLKAPKPRQFKPCAVEGCQGDANKSGGARGYCPAHYQRLVRGNAELKQPVSRQTGRVKVATSVSLHTWDVLYERQMREGTSMLETFRRVLKEEMPKYHKGVSAPAHMTYRGNDSRVNTTLELEEAVQLTNIARLSEDITVYAAAQRILEHYAWGKRTENVHTACAICAGLPPIVKKKGA